MSKSVIVQHVLRNAGISLRMYPCDQGDVHTVDIDKRTGALRGWTGMVNVGDDVRDEAIPLRRS